MKIRWEKTTHPQFIDGFVGQVCCFQAHRESKTRTTLICDLPHIRDDLYGRLVVHCSSPKEAAQHAQSTLEHWLTRFNDRRS